MNNAVSGIYAAVEFGGTSTRVALVQKTYVNNHLDSAVVLNKVQFPTTTPKEVFDTIGAYFKDKEFQAMGIASFGPIVLNKSDARYGCMTTTPKLLFQNVDVIGEIRSRLQEKEFQIEIDTDTNACAAAEHILRYKDLRSLAYISVGTGVGVGLLVDGKPVHGLGHPEGGHILVRTLPIDEKFTGVCIFHGNCLEGLVSNVSIAKRKNCSVHDLAFFPDDDPLWNVIGFYLSQLCLDLALFLGVEKIILGGGVFQRKPIVDSVKAHLVKMLNGYLDYPCLKDIESFIVPATFGSDEGVIGAATILDFQSDKRKLSR
eukprot:TRINITY_DN12029_c0_g1_i2.p1 TRINITY_DN12029_c0_g1~~TRINITY_DN12029_c0_g1_i2.p1  ORF type:complete len:316 (+),score=44.11 TRINITY_DN12029_c0_g1_i2:178-1125(+)